MLPVWKGHNSVHTTKQYQTTDVCLSSGVGPCNAKTAIKKKKRKWRPGWLSTTSRLIIRWLDLIDLFILLRLHVSRFFLHRTQWSNPYSRRTKRKKKGSNQHPFEEEALYHHKLYRSTDLLNQTGLCKHNAMCIVDNMNQCVPMCSNSECCQYGFALKDRMTVILCQRPLLHVIQTSPDDERKMDCRFEYDSSTLMN